MSPQRDIFSNVIDHFASDQEEMRSAAAFAAGKYPFGFFCFSQPTNLLSGNIAIGNLQQYLPAIIKMVESDPKKRLLALHASKEVRRYCPSQNLLPTEPL